MTEDPDPITWAQNECANLTHDQTSDVMSYLVGVFSSYVDNPDATPLTASRWRIYVRAAIHEVTREVR